MNKRAALYKYAKLYSYLIKYADFDPLPHSGILQTEQYFKNNGLPTQYIYKNMDLKNIYQLMYEQNLRDLAPVSSKTDMLERLAETRNTHQMIQNNRRMVQAAHDMRSILMPTYTPEQQQILKQTQIIPTEFLREQGQMLVGNYHLPGLNSLAVESGWDPGGGHEWEHVVDATRKRKVPNERFNPEGYDARRLLMAGNVADVPSNAAKGVYRTEQIANTVPQMRLRRLWGNRLNRDQRQILASVEQLAEISDRNYRDATQNGIIDPFIEQKIKSVPSISRQLNRQAKRQGVYSVAPDLGAYGFNSNGEKETVWSRYLAEARQANIDQKIIDANERKLSTIKAIQRHNRMHPNSRVSGMRLLEALAKIK